MPPEVETLLAALQKVGRDLKPELEHHHLRNRLSLLSRPLRAELVAVIDNVFEVTVDEVAARRQCHQLLASDASLQAKDAFAEAELLLVALVEHKPIVNVLAFIVDTLERIDARLPKGGQGPVAAWTLACRSFNPTVPLGYADRSPITGTEHSCLKFVTPYFATLPCCN